MVHIKKKNEIEVMLEGGRILAEVMLHLLAQAKPGVSELELNRLAEKLISKQGAEPAFKRVKGYRHTICTSTNDVVVHGVPTDYKFRDGDVVGIDCGVYYKGFNTDMAETVRIKNRKLKIEDRNDEIGQFLKTGRRALFEAIKQARPGNRVGHISQTIQDIVEGSGYSVVRSLVGHGVGKQLHEEPEVPGFLTGSIQATPLLRVGMTIAIEVIYNLGGGDVVLLSDGWTVKTKDGSLSGVFEKTVAVTREGSLVLTV